MDNYTPPGPVFGDPAPINTTSVTGPIKTWSFSSLINFEKCPWTTYLSRVKKIPQESHPAAERGTEIHKLAEDYVQGNLSDLPPELKRFSNDFVHLREQYLGHKVEIEGEWAFDQDWIPTAWNADNAWTRMKLDALVQESDSSCKIVDHKTGRKFGNEFKHSQQGQLYALGTFMKYPTLNFAIVEFWYLDKGEILQKSYSREQAMVFLPTWNKRATNMTATTEFIPQPSKSNCKYCPYGKLNGNSACEWSE